MSGHGNHAEEGVTERITDILRNAIGRTVQVLDTDTRNASILFHDVPTHRVYRIQIDDLSEPLPSGRPDYREARESYKETTPGARLTRRLYLDNRYPGTVPATSYAAPEESDTQLTLDNLRTMVETLPVEG